MVGGRVIGAFTRHDLDATTMAVAEAWTAGIDRDWSVPAGSLDWSCTQTADHTVDAVLAVAIFLASRRQDAYPDWGNGEYSLGPEARPVDLVEALVTVSRLLSGVVGTTPDDVRAIIWRSPQVEARPPVDFAARGALELVLHGHDVATGLGMDLTPPPDAMERLRARTRGWPHWSSPGWREPDRAGDAWAALLRASGRG